LFIEILAAAILLWSGFSIKVASRS
jgi:hypothetical protein